MYKWTVTIKTAEQDIVRSFTDWTLLSAFLVSFNGAFDIKSAEIVRSET